MTHIGPDTVITMTFKQLAAVVVTFIVAVSAVVHFTFGGLKNDVADIRNAVTAVQNRNADTLQSATAADGQLKAQLADLTAELRVTNAGLSTLASSVSGLDASIKAVDAKLVQSQLRQAAFERLVLL